MGPGEDPEWPRGNWSAPGLHQGWDGNEREPTFSPSIDVPDGWHGFIVRGRLCWDSKGLQPVNPVSSPPVPKGTTMRRVETPEEVWDGPVGTFAI